MFEITEWVVGDFDTQKGQELVLNALKHLVRVRVRVQVVRV